jgi:succinate dehydrogenase / fumarate reductase, cytochrome b subunit
MAETAKQRPGTMRLIEATQYSMPPGALVSILHRFSGIILFLLMPFLIWLFDTSLTSEISYSQFTSLFIAGVWFLPGWFFKLVVLGLIWAYLHHFIAGLRHLWMDVAHAVDKSFGRSSAWVTLALTGLLTLVLGIKLFY